MCVYVCMNVYVCVFVCVCVYVCVCMETDGLCACEYVYGDLDGLNFKPELSSGNQFDINSFHFYACA